MSKSIDAFFYTVSQIENCNKISTNWVGVLLGAAFYDINFATRRTLKRP